MVSVRTYLILRETLPLIKMFVVLNAYLAYAQTTTPTPPSFRSPMLSDVLTVVGFLSWLTMGGFLIALAIIIFFNLFPWVPAISAMANFINERILWILFLPVVYILLLWGLDNTNIYKVDDEGRVIGYDVYELMSSGPLLYRFLGWGLHKLGII